jgi:hypothetical protein
MTPDEAAEVLAFSDAIRARHERSPDHINRIAQIWAPILDGVTYDDCRKAIADLELGRVGNDRRRGDNVFHIAARARHHAELRASKARAANHVGQS